MSDPPLLAAYLKVPPTRIDWFVICSIKKEINYDDKGSLAEQGITARADGLPPYVTILQPKRGRLNLEHIPVKPLPVSSA